MTRKQYRRKMMQLQRDFTAWAKKNGYEYSKNTDRVNTPNWGCVITVGPHKDEILRSYAQMWDTIEYIFKGVDLMNWRKENSPAVAAAGESVQKDNNSLAR